MKWEKRNIITRTLEIIRKDRAENVLKSHYLYGDSISPEREIEISVTEMDKEILVVPHNTEHYSLTLKRELAKGTLEIYSDELKIGIIDEIEICYIHRHISDSNENREGLDEKYLFENNQLTLFKRNNICEEIPKDRKSVLDPCIYPYYESFKQIRPDISQSLENCLSELKR